MVALLELAINRIAIGTRTEPGLVTLRLHAGATPPSGPRIHQVRAELDELSDFLRKEEGR